MTIHPPPDQLWPTFCLECIITIAFCDAMVLAIILRGRPLIIWGGVVQNEKTNSFGGFPKKISVQGASEKKITFRSESRWKIFRSRKSAPRPPPKLLMVDPLRVLYPQHVLQYTRRGNVLLIAKVRMLIGRIGMHVFLFSCESNYSYPIYPPLYLLTPNSWLLIGWWQVYVFDVHLVRGVYHFWEVWTAGSWGVNQLLDTSNKVHEDYLLCIPQNPSITFKTELF